MIDPKLIDFCETPRQREIFEAILEHNCARKAEKALGLSENVAYRSYRRLKKRAALAGYSPEHDMVHSVPDGFKVRGVSTYYDAEGQPRGQWVKSTADDARRMEMMRDAVEGLASQLQGLSQPVAAPSHTDDDLMVVYPMGDPHFGLYAYAEETGDDFDLDIAERITCRAIDRLVDSVPSAATAMLLNLGDAFHADDSSNQTPSSHNSLDVDTRFAKVAQVTLRAMAYCVRRLLEKHENVIVWNMAGNHDPHSALWLALCMDSYFNNDPRVTVDLSPSLYKFHRFGKVLLGAHHGHGAKSADLPLLMAADRPEDWGATKYRHWMCGHIHHWTAKEHPGVIVETFRTLAGKDAWHAGKGYRSGRDMNAICFHREFGEIQRTKCDIAMVV